jgi:disulfide bond formation protein DsbB
MTAIDTVLKRWPIFALLISAVMLAIAHAFETFGHLPPCHLCLEQREVYWATLGISAAASLAMYSPIRAPGRKIGCAILALTFAYGAYLAGFHAGAEWKWWPAPETCASGKATMAGVLALMRGAAAKTPACDQAAWVFLGLSMAGWNFLVSVGLVVVSAVAVVRPRNAT